MSRNFTKFAFTKSVKEAQERYGSRKSYAHMEESGDRYVLTETEIPFIKSRDSFYMATVGENGWPYVQFRGGPKGFLKILDNTTLGIADFRTTGGNTQDLPRHLFRTDKTGGRIMISTHERTPSEKNRRILENLKKTVAETLEKKRKLGQYAVIWDGQKPVQSGADAPASKD